MSLELIGAVVAVATIIATVLFGVWRMIEGVRSDLGGRVDGVRQSLTTRTDVIGQDVTRIAQDVSYMAGRQAERDFQEARGSRSPDPPGRRPHVN